MQFDKSRLLDFLETLDNEMTERITIVAVGGTAMTILNLKTSTIDIDFTVPSSDYQEFEKAFQN
jgi:hypothetical protein